MVSLAMMVALIFLAIAIIVFIVSIMRIGKLLKKYWPAISLEGHSLTRKFLKINLNFF